MAATRLVTSIVALPNGGIRRKFTTGRGAELINPATNLFTDGSAQCGTARRLPIRPTHTGHHIVDLVDEATRDDATGKIVHFPDIERHAICGTASATVLTMIQISHGCLFRIARCPDTSSQPQWSHWQEWSAPRPRQCYPSHPSAPCWHRERHRHRQWHQ